MHIGTFVTNGMHKGEWLMIVGVYDALHWQNSVVNSVWIYFGGASHLAFSSLEVMGHEAHFVRISKVCI